MLRYLYWGGAGGRRFIGIGTHLVAVLEELSTLLRIHLPVCDGVERYRHAEAVRVVSIRAGDNGIRLVVFWRRGGGGGDDDDDVENASTTTASKRCGRRNSTTDWTTPRGRYWNRLTPIGRTYWRTELWRSRGGGIGRGSTIGRFSRPNTFRRGGGRNLRWPRHRA